MPERGRARPGPLQRAGRPAAGQLMCFHFRVSPDAAPPVRHRAAGVGPDRPPVRPRPRLTVPPARSVRCAIVPPSTSPRCGATVHRDGIAGAARRLRRRPGSERLREDFDALFAEARSRPRRDDRPRAAPLLLRGAAGAGARLRRPGHPPGCHRAVRARCSVRSGRWSSSASTCRCPARSTSRGTATSRCRRTPGRGGVLTSLAFNVTTVTVTPEMGPLEIVPGSQWEDGDDFGHGMFPPAERAAGYAARAVPRLPRRRRRVRAHRPDAAPRAPPTGPAPPGRCSCSAPSRRTWTPPARTTWC